MKNPLVSIIVPSYNRAVFLPATFDSLLSQDYAEKEIVVVDDGSTDNTSEVCARYPVRYFRQENRGVSAARNFGAANCSGSILMFLDSDDLCPTGSLRRRVESWMEEPHYAHVTGRIRFFQENVPGNMHFLHPEEEAFHFLIHGAEIVTRDAFEKAGGFDETIGIGEDVDLWLRMSDLGLRQKLIPEICLFYRKHAGNVTRDRDRSKHGFLSVLHRTIERRRTRQSQSTAP